MSPTKRQELTDAKASDVDLQPLQKVVSTGWPTRPKSTGSIETLLELLGRNKYQQGTSVQRN